MDEGKVLLEMQHISKAFPGVQALDNVSIYALRGEVLALVGENGAGKSTLIKILAGAYKMDSGDVILDGEKVVIGNPLEAHDKGIQVIYQELSLLRDMTPVENMFVGKWIINGIGMIDWAAMNAHVKEVFNEFGLKVPLDVPCGKLSVAECQMIEIIRGISSGAKIIVMDEPTSSLSTKEVKVLFSMIRSLKARGITVIYISHRLEELFNICDRVYVMKDGKNSGEFVVGDVTKDDIITAMIGRKLDSYYPSRDDIVQAPEIIFEVKNVCLDTRVKNVSFQVHRGEILGIAGLVGAGRTELMRSIFKAEPTAKGEIYIDGVLQNIKSPKNAIAAGIGFATEDRKNEGLIEIASIATNITIANLTSIEGIRGLINLQKEKRIVTELKDRLAIKSPSIRKVVKELSGGNQQKVVIAKWLNSNVKIYIFDEPTRGVDVGAKAEIYQLMDKVARAGNAVIMVSSELPEILGCCDRILVVSEGKITAEFMKCEATEEKIMKAAVGGAQE